MWWLHGDPLHVRTRRDPAEMLAAKLVQAENGCLEWTGYRNMARGGYGLLGSPPVYVHRLAYRLAHPDEPEPPVVRHSCDNPPCCNPDHLLGGTVADNNRDRVEHGRNIHGESCHLAKLTAVDVNDIRAEYARGVLTQQMLGDAYGVTFSNISAIIKRKSWA
jgi:hypothetical protein